MTTAELRELLELCERATPGPWRIEGKETDAGTAYQHIAAGWKGVADTYHSDPIGFYGGTPFGGPVDEDGYEWISSRPGEMSDARFIAAADPSTVARLVRVALAARALSEFGTTDTCMEFDAALAAVFGGDDE